MDSKCILQKIENYLAETKMADSTFGRKAVNDGKAVKRLRAGKRMWPETLSKLQEFMATNPPSSNGVGERHEGEAA